MIETSNNIQNMKPWWESDKNDVHSNLKGHLEYLKTRYSDRSDRNLRHLRLFGISEMFGLQDDYINSIRRTEKLRVNIIRQVVEAAQAKISKHKPKARFLTEGGDSIKQNEAKKTEKFCTGVAYNDDHWQKSNVEFLHASVFGTSARKFYIGPDGNPVSENVLIENIKIDESEVAISGDGKPRALYQEEFVNISVLKARYPKLKNKFIPSGDVSHSFFSGADLRDMIKVTEGWKLPSTEGGADGRHVICVSNMTILDEKYTEDDFPFEFFTFAPNVLGFFGQGIPERLLGLQLEINKLLRDIQDIIHLGCVPKIFAQTGSITKNHINNAIGTVVEFMGSVVPQMAQLMAVPQELFIQLEKLIKFAFEEVGLSVLSAHSEKPVGLNSGKALREFSDIESDRFAILSERWEDYHMRCFKKYLKIAEKAAEEYPDLTSRALDDKGFEVIRLDELNINELDFVVRPYPVNMLSDRPAGRLADIRDLLDSGLITPEEGKMLLDFPDIKKHMSQSLAPARYIQRTIDVMVDKGVYMPPDQFQDLELGIKLFVSAINQFRMVDVPPENIFLLEQWVTDALAIKETAQEEAMQEEMAKQQVMGGMQAQPPQQPV